jgi:hypothetical protein
VKTTKADFDYFVKRCKHWIKVLGINGWEIEYKHTNLPGQLARWGGDSVSMHTTLYLGIDWEETEPTKKELDLTALHEVLHLLLGEIQNLGDTRYTTEDHWHSAIHVVINRLIKTLR